MPLMLPPWAVEYMDVLCYVLYFELAGLGALAICLLPRCMKKETFSRFSGEPPTYEECEIRFTNDPPPPYAELNIPDMAVPQTSPEAEANVESASNAETKIDMDPTVREENDPELGSDLSAGVDSDETEKSRISSSDHEAGETK